MPGIGGGARRVLTRILRSSITRARAWLHEGEDQEEDRDFSQDMVAYPWLNHLVNKINREISDGVYRPQYTWGLVHAGHLAKQLGLRALTAIEFGVAGGNGLVSLERAASALEREMDVEFEVVGFDTGYGLPAPRDYRDLPNLWSAGAYAMDEARVRARLERSSLLLGLVADTLPGYVRSEHAPVGFIAFDLDIYSSTVDALLLLEASPEGLLPRVHCYFDDVVGFTYGQHNGPLLAIREFNERNPQRQIWPPPGLRHYMPPQFKESMWVEKLYMAHIVDHPLYGRHDDLIREWPENPTSGRPGA